MKCKKFVPIAVLLIICVFAGCAVAAPKVFHGKKSIKGDAPTIKLLKIIVDIANPEKIILAADAEPTPDGQFGHLAVFVTGANYEGYRVDYMAVDLAFLKMKPVKEWRDYMSLRPESFMRGNLEARVTEKDVNDAIALLHKRESEKEEQPWNNVKASFRDGRIKVNGEFRISGNLGGEFIVNTGLEIRKGKQLWLTEPMIHINGDEQTDVIREEINKIQPLFDITEFTFPVILSSVLIQDSTASIFTKTRPNAAKFRDYAVFYEYTR